MSRVCAAALGVAVSKQAVSRFCRLLAAGVALGVAAPSASAQSDKKLQDLLGEMWVTIVETPFDENLFNPDAVGANPCIDLGGVMVAFEPLPPIEPPEPSELTCTVNTGTKIFVLGATFECSTSELGDDATEEDLRTCAEENDVASAPVVTLDGEPVQLTEVTTDPVSYELPPSNIFGTDTLSGQLVAHGWVALLHPMTPGEHVITIDFEGDGILENRTTIIVEPGASLRRH
ncbi:hypothetical protein QHF85_49280 [Polyangium sp. 6x1]|nr:hypothetical protein [Polyangium sp. 6x1]